MQIYMKDIDCSSLVRLVFNPFRVQLLDSWAQQIPIPAMDINNDLYKFYLVLSTMSYSIEAMRISSKFLL